jgi:hypothetical protein
MIPPTVLPTKDPGSVIVVACDFSRRLDEGETIPSCTLSVSVLFGADEGAAGMASGSVDLSEFPLLKQRVVDGLSGVRYLLRFKAVTSKGRILVGSAVLPVQDGGA